VWETHIRFGINMIIFTEDKDFYPHIVLETMVAKTCIWIVMVRHYNKYEDEFPIHQKVFRRI
jgi:hypothetical protein